MGIAKYIILVLVLCVGVALQYFSSSHDNMALVVPEQSKEERARIEEKRNAIGASVAKEDKKQQTGQTQVKPYQPTPDDFKRVRISCENTLSDHARKNKFNIEDYVHANAAWIDQCVNYQLGIHD